MAGLWNMKRWSDDVFLHVSVCLLCFLLSRKDWWKSFLLTSCVAFTLQRLIECYCFWFCSYGYKMKSYNKRIRFSWINFPHNTKDGAPHPITSSPSNNQVNLHHFTNSPAIRKVIELRKNYSGECSEAISTHAPKLATHYQNYHIIWPNWRIHYTQSICNSRINNLKYCGNAIKLWSVVKCYESFKIRVEKVHFKSANYDYL